MKPSLINSNLKINIKKGFPYETVFNNEDCVEFSYLLNKYSQDELIQNYGSFFYQKDGFSANQRLKHYDIIDKYERNLIHTIYSAIREADHSIRQAFKFFFTYHFKEKQVNPFMDEAYTHLNEQRLSQFHSLTSKNINNFLFRLNATKDSLDTSFVIDSIEMPLFGIILSFSDPFIKDSIAKVFNILSDNGSPKGSSVAPIYSLIREFRNLKAHEQTILTKKVSTVADSNLKELIVRYNTPGFSTDEVISSLSQDLDLLQMEYEQKAVLLNKVYSWSAEEKQLSSNDIIERIVAMKNEINDFDKYSNDTLFEAIKKSIYKIQSKKNFDKNKDNMLNNSTRDVFDLVVYLSHFLETQFMINFINKIEILNTGLLNELKKSGLSNNDSVCVFNLVLAKIGFNNKRKNDLIKEVYKPIQWELLLVN